MHELKLFFFIMILVAFVAGCTSTRPNLKPITFSLKRVSGMRKLDRKVDTLVTWVRFDKPYTGVVDSLTFESFSFLGAGCGPRLLNAHLRLYSADYPGINQEYLGDRLSPYFTIKQGTYYSNKVVNLPVPGFVLLDTIVEFAYHGKWRNRHTIALRQSFSRNGLYVYCAPAADFANDFVFIKGLGHKGLYAIKYPGFLMGKYWESYMSTELQPNWFTYHPKGNPGPWLKVYAHYDLTSELNHDLPKNKKFKY